ELLTVENLRVDCGGKKILRGVNFSVKRGEILIIAGESGSGKSTILKAIGGLLGKNFSVGGKIFFDGRDITHLADNERRKISGDTIGFIFQNAGASFCPIRKIGEQIFESVRTHRDWDKKFFRERATEFMRKINLDPAALDEYPFRLSGGMAQRAGILAATILEPTRLLADEPTSPLDVVTQVEVVKELLNLRGRLKISIVLVTHDLKVARRMADKFFILRHGLAVEFGTREKIFNAPQEIYTRELIGAANL
ncbi:MAG: ABC transporter ATP-binding protein, partial [Selenomonadaceae bacterium]|nr:ABC transporter ATP-binding protein [Selenomonadaceae bacterium]